MSIPAWIDTSNVEANFVVANTPNFLVRRLKEDKATPLLSQAVSGEELLKTYVAAIQREPNTIRELVTPYLCLAALSLKPEMKFLKDAQEFRADPLYKWMPPFLRF